MNEAKMEPCQINSKAGIFSVKSMDMDFGENHISEQNLRIISKPKYSY